MTRFAVYNLARNNDFDYSKAQRTRPYEETLRDEARWLVAEGYIEGKGDRRPGQSDPKRRKDPADGKGYPKTA